MEDEVQNYLDEGYAGDAEYGNSVVTEMHSNGIGQMPRQQGGAAANPRVPVSSGGSYVPRSAPRAQRRGLGDVTPAQACLIQVLQKVSWAALTRSAANDALGFSQSLGALATLYGRHRASLAAVDPAFPAALDGYWSERTRNVVRSLLAAAFGTARREGYDAASGLPTSAAELPEYIRTRLVSQVPSGSALTDLVQVVERAPVGSVATWLERAATEEIAAGCRVEGGPTEPEGDSTTRILPSAARLFLPQGMFRFVTSSTPTTTPPESTGADDGGGTTPPPPRNTGSGGGMTPYVPPPTPTSRAGSNGAVMAVGVIAVAALAWWLLQDTQGGALRGLEIGDGDA